LTERRESDATTDLDRLLDGVLAALRVNRAAGAAALWSSFDAAARRPLGDVTTLERVLENALLAPLVGHTHAQRTPWNRHEAVARTTLDVAGTQGTVRYVISARFRPETGWRLTGLRRDDLPLT
jgi:hypothetical protein